MAKTDETNPTDPVTPDPSLAPDTSSDAGATDTTPTTSASSPESPSEAPPEASQDASGTIISTDPAPEADASDSASVPAADASTSADGPTSDSPEADAVDPSSPSSGSTDSATATSAESTDGGDTPIYDSLTGHTQTAEEQPIGGTGVIAQAFPDAPEVITSEAPPADPDADPLDETAVPTPAFYAEKDGLGNLRIQRWGWVGPEPLLIENGQIDEFKAFVITL